MIKIVKRAADAVGNGVKLAAAVGLTKQAVGQWQRIPAEHVLAVERASGIPREELRPDLYPKAVL